MKKVIGIAAARKYENYEAWIKRAGDTEVFKLSYELDNFESIKKCNGIVLAGGEDVHPARYKMPELVKQFKLKDIDEKRDAFEWKVLEYTQQNNIPVLGICRGLQLANIFFGGTLIPDIDSSGKPDHTRISKTIDRYHKVSVKPNTLLASIVNLSEGEVNSSHHQSANRIADGLVVNAVSPDGIIEGLERVDKSKPYLMLVQWHPERMTDMESQLTRNIRNSFLGAIKIKEHASH